MFEASGYWLALAATGVILSFVPRDALRARALLLVAASVLVLLAVVEVPFSAFGILCGSFVWMIVGLRWTAGIARAGRPTLAALIVFSPLVVAWGSGKIGVTLDAPHLRLFAFVGFSFVFVKAWTVLKDVHDGRIKDLDPLVLSAYLLFFPTYVAGPIHLYGEFNQTLREPDELDASAVIDIVYRVLLGFVKIRVVTPFLKPMSLHALTELQGVPPTALVMATLTYSIVIWADFSGYSDLAIATTRVLRHKSPENFNAPYAAANPREFWQRWHISFSRILTSYVFVPVTRALSGKLGNRKNAVMVIGYLVTFLFCGWWHGATVNFLLWGLYHAVGLIVYDLWRNFAVKRRLISKNRLLRVAATLATFTFVSIGWVLFAIRMP